MELRPELLDVIQLKRAIQKNERETEKQKVIYIKLKACSNVSSWIHSFQSNLKHPVWITSVTMTADYQKDNSNILYECCFHIFHWKLSRKLMEEWRRLQQEGKSDGKYWICHMWASMLSHRLQIAVSNLYVCVRIV